MEQMEEGGQVDGREGGGASREGGQAGQGGEEGTHEVGWSDGEGRALPPLVLLRGRHRCRLGTHVPLGPLRDQDQRAPSDRGLGDHMRAFSLCMAGMADGCIAVKDATTPPLEVTSLNVGHRIQVTLPPSPFSPPLTSPLLSPCAHSSPLSTPLIAPIEQPGLLLHCGDLAGSKEREGVRRGGRGREVT